MRIVILGGFKNRERFAQILERLGFLNNPYSVDFPENLFAKAHDLRGAEQMMVKFHPVDFLAVEQSLSLGLGSMSCEEIATLIKSWHKGFFSGTKVVLMQPVDCFETAYFKSRARSAGIKFLADPDDIKAVKKCFKIKGKDKKASPVRLTS